MWLLGPAPTSPASASTASGGSECSRLGSVRGERIDGFVEIDCGGWRWDIEHDRNFLFTKGEGERGSTKSKLPFLALAHDCRTLARLGRKLRGLLEEPEELPEPIPPEPELELPELFEESELPETAPEPLPAAATELPELVTRRDGFRSFGVRGGGAVRLRFWGRGRKAPAAAPAPAATVEETTVARLALPVWQTMLAGGLACVAHRAVAGSVEDLLKRGGVRQAPQARSVGVEMSFGTEAVGGTGRSFFQVGTSRRFADLHTHWRRCAGSGQEPAEVLWGISFWGFVLQLVCALVKPR